MQDKIQIRGINIFELLLAMFVVLKLADVIDWSWWWILAPFWIPLIIGMIVGFVYHIIKAIQ